MPHPKRTPMQQAAAAKDDAKAKRKKLGLLASIASALGLSDADAQPSARMSKRTEVTKHTVTEEDDGDDAEEEEEEEEEEESEETDSSIDTEGTEDSSAAEEEEEEEEEERSAKYSEEEEEERAQARAVAKAYKSPAVRDAFLAAIPEKHRAAASLRAPSRLFREMKRATGAKSIDDAMVALSRKAKPAKKAAAPAAETIRANAKIEAKIAKLEADGRKQRVSAIVEQAKAEGRASSKDLREQLRAYGMANGTKALRAFVATLPKAIRTKADGEFVPRAGTEGEVLGGMGGAGGAEASILEGMTAGMTAEQKTAFMADYNTRKAANGAARTPRS